VGESAADLLTIPQSRLSGNFFGSCIRADKFYQKNFSRLKARNLQAIELPQGRDRVCRCDYHGESALRARNHDRGVWLRPGRFFAPADRTGFSEFSTAWITRNGPLHDPFLKHPYSAARLAGKQKNKIALQKELGFAGAAESPLFGTVRGSPNKKVWTSNWARSRKCKRGHPVRLIGSGSAAYDAPISISRGAFHPRSPVRIGYDEGLSHRIEAGCDF